MRILVLTPGVFDKGGIARYGRFQIRALREEHGAAAIEVVSLAGRDAGDLEEPFDAAWCGPAPFGPASRPLFVLAAFGRALAGRPDVVLTQHINLGPIGWVLARTVGARLAQTIYGDEVWSTKQRHRLLALRHSDLVISDCHNTADLAVSLGLVDRKPEVVWDCVDLERYTPGPADPGVLESYGLRPTGRFRVLFLGRIQPFSRYKGTERLLRLVSDLPGDRFEVVFAGKGSDVDYLRELSGRLGMAERTAFTGAIREADMPHVYRAADAFYLVSEVGPSKGEGIPLTPLEAMACGVPVLVGSEDGSRETLDGAGGVCCDPSDLRRQSEYLLRLAREPELHRAERSAARRRAEEAFGYPAFAVKTREAIRSLAPRDPGAADARRRGSAA
jgi:phosphatidylinositol alpha-1,6-mannosyltransferase